MVFLLGRFGDTKEALTLIINELKDMQYAIAFCHEHGDPELWTDLIDHCVDKPGRIRVDSNLVNNTNKHFAEFVTFLLQSIGNYVDPTALIQKIKGDMKIPGLKNSLVKMLNQYNLQVILLTGDDCIFLLGLF